ncbi:unnamed protein product [Rotaria sp. Silwood2]|nr:unnamed protein product [Rotaria sp. Silwood2]CAF4231767.1 unnamed protein product [Rotaria sp. Silwood2]
MPTVRVLVDKNRGEKYGIDYLTESDDEPEDEELQEKLGDHVKLTASDLPPINAANSLADKGSRISFAIQALKEFGTCLESIWQINKRPSDEAYEAAQDHKIIDALKVNIDLNEMKTCLAQGYPFVFDLKTFGLYEKGKKKVLHVMLAVGYIDRMKSFIVRNSWGENIVIFHITDPKYCRDAYSIRRLATDDIGYDNWCYDDHSDNSDEEEDNGNDFYIIDEEVKEKQEKQ